MQKQMEKRKIVVIWEFILHFSIQRYNVLAKAKANWIKTVNLLV